MHVNHLLKSQFLGLICASPVLLFVLSAGAIPLHPSSALWMGMISECMSIIFSNLAAWRLLRMVDSQFSCSTSMPDHSHFLRVSNATDNLASPQDPSFAVSTVKMKAAKIDRR
jgi:hypothetical protein